MESQHQTIYAPDDDQSLTHLVLHILDLSGVQRTSSQTEIRQLDVTARIDQEVLSDQRLHVASARCRQSAYSEAMQRVTHLRLQVSMNVAQLVQLGNSAEHFGNVESGMLFLQDARVIEKSTEVSTSNKILLSCNVQTVCQSERQERRAARNVPWRDTHGLDLEKRREA